MIDEELGNTRKLLAACEEQLSQCVAELDNLSQKLSEVRERQKARFGDLLLRTTLNQSIRTLKDMSRQEESKGS